MIGASFSELAQALISAGRFDEAAEIAQRGLTHLQGDISAYRVHLFAALAEARAMGPDHHLAEESWRAALALSAQLSDPKVMGRALGARSVAYFQLFRLRETAEDGLRSEQLGGLETAPWPGALQLLILNGTLLYLGRLDEGGPNCQCAGTVIQKNRPVALGRNLQFYPDLDGIGCSPPARQV